MIEHPDFLRFLKTWGSVRDLDLRIALVLAIDHASPDPPCLFRYDCPFALKCDGSEDCMVYLPDGGVE